MTIAISLKVLEGVVLAADSAASMMVRNNGTVSVVNIYDTANKVFNLHKGLPIGAITWGAGSVGPNSIAMLAKDFRVLISGSDPAWAIDPKGYTMEEVATKFHKFVFDMHYAVAFKDWPEKPVQGFIVAGYSANSGLAEEWLLQYNGQGDPAPKLLRRAGEIGWAANGEPEAITRLLNGFSPHLLDILVDKGFIKQEDAGQVFSVCQQALGAQVVSPGMPIQDAIGLAEFLVDTAIKFSKYTPGPPTVGGPVEVAAITKHEGFKWVRRKHYFEARLNPKEV